MTIAKHPTEQQIPANCAPTCTELNIFAIYVAIRFRILSNVLATIRERIHVWMRSLPSRITIGIIRNVGSGVCISITSESS